MSLAYETFMETIERLYASLPTYYYGTSEALTPGKVVYGNVPGWPKTIFCHPDDLELIREKIRPYANLLPLSEWRPNDESIAEAFVALREHLQDIHVTIPYTSEISDSLEWKVRYGFRR